MGILIDIILIAIIILSAFLGYKKGLVKLGAKLFAGIIAIIVAVIIYKPVAEIVVQKTPIQGKIKDAIVQNAENIINNNEKVPEGIANHVESNILPTEANNISKNIVYALTGIVLYIAIKIILSIVISLMDVIAKLPILKQFNEIGGIIYGLIRGGLIACICVLLMGAYTKINPESTISNTIDSSYLTKIAYKNIVKF